MKTKLIFILTSFLMSSTISMANSTESITSMQEDEPYAKYVKAKVIQKKSYNKAGKELPGYGDFFLKIKGKEYFIKLSICEISVDVLKKYLNQKMEYRIGFREGLWDTDDPNVQSRIGEYVHLISIKE